MSAEQKEANWPDLRGHRLLEKAYLEHAARQLEAAYPTHVWPRPADGTARSLDPGAVQAGFVEGVRFACQSLYDMANEAGSDADTLEVEAAS